MSEPYFPPPGTKQGAPYRAAAEVPLERPIRRTVVRPTAPAPTRPRRPGPSAASAGATPEHVSFLTTFLVRFGVRVGALAIVLGVLYLLVWAGEGGAKWPQAVWVVLGVAGILAVPFVLFVRIRRLWRLLFGSNDET